MTGSYGLVRSTNETLKLIKTIQKGLELLILHDLVTSRYSANGHHWLPLILSFFPRTKSRILWSSSFVYWRLAAIFSMIEKGMIIWFPGPPLTMRFNSKGITLRLDSAKRYQKPFRGSHQGTTLTRCGQDWVWHTWLLSLALPKGWLPQLVFYPRREFSRGQFEFFLLFFVFCFFLVFKNTT